MTLISAQELINKFELEQHPEGGWYRRFYESEATVGNDNRFAGTAIYYLLEKNDQSVFHSLKQEEIWHFIHGDVARLHFFRNDEYGTHTFSTNLLTHAPTFTIKPNDIFAAEIVDGDFGFFTCHVCPGFRFEDFQISDKTVLLEKFPHNREVIERFCK